MQEAKGAHGATLQSDRMANATRVPLAIAGAFIIAISAIALSGEPLPGTSLPMSNWLLASYLWVLALLELSPWPFLTGARRGSRLLTKLAAVAIFVCLVFQIGVDRKLGGPIGIFAVAPMIAAYVFRLVLALNGIQLWKATRNRGDRP